MPPRRLSQHLGSLALDLGAVAAQRQQRRQRGGKGSAPPAAPINDADGGDGHQQEELAARTAAATLCGGAKRGRDNACAGGEEEAGHVATSSAAAVCRLPSPPPLVVPTPNRPPSMGGGVASRRGRPDVPPSSSPLLLLDSCDAARPTIVLGAPPAPPVAVVDSHTGGRRRRGAPPPLLHAPLISSSAEVTSATTTAVVSVLTSVGLQGYTVPLLHHGFDTLAAFAQLDADDLDVVGVRPHGHRKVLLQAARRLRLQLGFGGAAGDFGGALAPSDDLAKHTAAVTTRRGRQRDKGGAASSSGGVPAATAAEAKRVMEPSKPLMLLEGGSAAPFVVVPTPRPSCNTWQSLLVASGRHTDDAERFMRTPRPPLVHHHEGPSSRDDRCGGEDPQSRRGAPSRGVAIGDADDGGDDPLATEEEWQMESDLRRWLSAASTPPDPPGASDPAASRDDDEDTRRDGLPMVAAPSRGGASKEVETTAWAEFTAAYRRDCDQVLADVRQRLLPILERAANGALQRVREHYDVAASGLSQSTSYLPPGGHAARRRGPRRPAASSQRHPEGEFEEVVESLVQEQRLPAHLLPSPPRLVIRCETFVNHHDRDVAAAVVDPPRNDLLVLIPDSSRTARRPPSLVDVVNKNAENGRDPRSEEGREGGRAATSPPPTTTTSMAMNDEKDAEPADPRAPRRVEPAATSVVLVGLGGGGFCGSASDLFPTPPPSGGVGRRQELSDGHDYLQRSTPDDDAAAPLSAAMSSAADAFPPPPFAADPAPAAATAEAAGNAPAGAPAAAFARISTPIQTATLTPTAASWEAGTTTTATGPAVEGSAHARLAASQQGAATNATNTNGESSASSRRLSRRSLRRHDRATLRSMLRIRGTTMTKQDHDGGGEEDDGDTGGEVVARALRTDPTPPVFQATVALAPEGEQPSDADMAPEGEQPHGADMAPEGEQPPDADGRSSADGPNALQRQVRPPPPLVDGAPTTLAPHAAGAVGDDRDAPRRLARTTPPVVIVVLVLRGIVDVSRGWSNAHERHGGFLAAPPP